MYTLILPVAGESSRYPDQRPKFLLTHPNGKLMITNAIKYIIGYNAIIIIGLQKHEDKYKFSVKLLEEIITETKCDNVQILLLPEPTHNQPETVYNGLKSMGIEDISIFIKDCDNQFQVELMDVYNFVAIADLNNYEVKASNKSYVNTNEFGTITNIVEKEIVSNKFCIGGYGFNNVNDYYLAYENLKHFENLYISHLIYYLINIQKQTFKTIECNNYFDWGTLEDWQKYKNKFQTLFIDLDGVLSINSSKHFEPLWNTTEIIKENVEYINKLYAEGYTFIIITTCRDDVGTCAKYLNDKNIKYHQIITNLPHCKRILINDYSNTNTYPTAIAINIKRNDNNLKELL